MRHQSVFVLVLWGLLPASTLACLWDYDTLKMERQQFPGIAELISGKFLRHSPEFYEWRIADRQKRIRSASRDVRLYDDLAVAYDKTGRHEQAIQIMLEAEQIQPDRYETYANLGTFHIHNGDLNTGSQFISRAIEINPDAHFGREIYQKLLVEYVLQQRGDGTLPQPMSTQEARFGNRGFAQFLAGRMSGEQSGAGTKTDFAAAVKGISGMMRFGHHDSPVLLEALADLLMARTDDLSRRLAARAWLKASYSVQDPEVAARYREVADEVLSLQTAGQGHHSRISLESVEQQFQTELAEADSWFEQLCADERSWIAAGEDVDQRFSEKYYSSPTLTPSPEAVLSRGTVRDVQTWALPGGLAVMGGVCIATWMAFRRRNGTGSAADDHPGAD